MTKYTLTRNSCLILLLSLASVASAQSPDTAAATDLHARLDDIRKQHNAPALAAALIPKTGPVRVAAVGVRSHKSETPVEDNDRFHLGSCTKSMTATLCAILVEENKLSWNTTVGETFPDFDEIHAGFRGVTLTQLLCHRSGLPEDRRPDGVFIRLVALRGEMKYQRKELVKIVLAQQPAAKPGTEFQYSNAGYAVAGAMAEAVTGKTWETLLAERLFQPLGINTFGFGAPGKAGTLDQPRGHIAGFFAEPAPIEPDQRRADNPAVIGPAGTVHMSVADWARYVRFHLGPYTGNTYDAILSAKAIQHLHTDPYDQKYGFGWAMRATTDGRKLSHAGSNGRWFAQIDLDTGKGTGWMAATNQSDDEAREAVRQAMKELRHLAKD